MQFKDEGGDLLFEPGGDSAGAGRDPQGVPIQAGDDGQFSERGGRGGLPDVLQLSQQAHGFTDALQFG